MLTSILLITHNIIIFNYILIYFLFFFLICDLNQTMKSFWDGEQFIEKNQEMSWHTLSLLKKMLLAPANA